MASQTAQPVLPVDYQIELEIDDRFRADVDVTSISTAATETLRHEGIRRAALTIVITDDGKMRDLNRTYREVDAPTDVLSFASQEQIDQDPEITLPPELQEEMNAYLGDIVIAFPYARRQAARFDNSIVSELRLLVVHGTLHLLGYNHDSPTSKARMWVVQNRVLVAFGDEGLSERNHGT